MNISEHFFKSARAFPDKLAIIDREEAITFAELRLEVERTASYFREKEIRKGDRVLVFVPMSTTLYRVVLALFSIGAVPVFLDEWVALKRLKVCCKAAKCKAFVASSKIKFLGFFIHEIRSIPIKLSPKKKRNAPFELESVSNVHPALITFTTGSTGIPKAAVRSHGFLQEQFRVINKEVKPSHDDVEAVSLPILLFMNLAYGCTSVIARLKNKKKSSEHWESLLKEYATLNVNRITCSPSEIIAFSDFLIRKKITLSSVQQIYTGGGPVFPQQAIMLQSAFPKSDIFIIYGATEAEPISSISAKMLIEKDKLACKGLKVGKIHEHISLRILDLTQQSFELSPSDFQQSCLADGNIGEIIVSGAHVLDTYLNEASSKQNKLKVGQTLWHRTGDSGFVENETLYLTGRVAQLIYKNEKIISPFVIENNLQNYPAIEKGTLIKKDGQLILCLELKNMLKLNENSIFDFHYDKIKILKKIPLDPRHHTKIDYEALARMV
jgi:acyl-CoA synthetase (AMP-forming)/AMP-acid ligase II